MTFFEKSVHVCELNIFPKILGYSIFSFEKILGHMYMRYNMRNMTKEHETTIEFLCGF